MRTLAVVKKRRGRRRGRARGRTSETRWGGASPPRRVPDKKVWTFPRQVLTVIVQPNRFTRRQVDAQGAKNISETQGNKPKGSNTKDQERLGRAPRELEGQEWDATFLSYEEQTFPAPRLGGYERVPTWSFGRECKKHERKPTTDRRNAAWFEKETRELFLRSLQQKEKQGRTDYNVDARVQ